MIIEIRFPRFQPETISQSIEYAEILRGIREYLRNIGSIQEVNQVGMQPEDCWLGLKIDTSRLIG
jgi:hypothetical protein